MARIDYARVSTREAQQVFDRQVDALREAGCEPLIAGLRPDLAPASTVPASRRASIIFEKATCWWCSTLTA